uniref:CSON015582 protein n=1 Tax=Culicoides sonorensis TaxID=179676 RepID=A0A336LNZ1_CULSO
MKNSSESKSQKKENHENEKEKLKICDKNTFYSEKIPPDGGWGWIIVIAFAVANMLLMSTVNVFTLVFKDKFNDLGLSATDTTLIINLNSVVGMAMGIVIGPMLKILGYRKVSIIGGAIFALGIIFTAWGNNVTYFICTYSVCSAIGLGLCSSSFPLAVNTYFKERRTKAFGIAVTIAGLGPIIFPQLVSILLKLYGVTGCYLIIGGICLHVVAAGLLLQPIKYHYKYATQEQQILYEINIINNEENTKENYQYCSKKSKIEDQISENNTTKLIVPVINEKNEQENDKNMMSRKSSISASVANIEELYCNGQDTSIQNANSPVNKLQSKQYNKSFTKKLVKLFDLDLLKDFRFLNLLMGISIAVFAEINFSLLTPLILSDKGYDNVSIASFMSTLGIADIIFRFFAPFIGDWMKQSAQVMCIYSFVIAIIGRAMVMFSRSITELLGIAIGLGVAKGFRSVYLNLVIPAYLPLDRLPSASGIQMLSKGMILILLGPLLGVIRDITGSYTKCIYVINTVTFITVSMWTIEILYYRSKKKSMNCQLEFKNTKNLS